ncbi:hypothetical protein Acid345_2707 [Candidatus Koribacter versatilis Ellin345]|uniref:Peptidase MA-like domain-containing protein n=1 Tax=Koribacter versatilis (strain Ellin345) TaxID=204669 RepID=Q1IN42_KORVE|nr:hypothetical protein [Candidatus Koribacter versatilis]ABF41708.1 hypothetical protein Acid345_2707 [Candidatus Koribacter versatilis Ellin345]
MRILPRFAIALLVCAVGAAHAQTIDDLRDQWRTINTTPPPRDFRPLIPKLLTYREQEGGKSWQLNYLLGSSYCRISGQEKSGRVALSRVLSSYGLPDVAKQAAESVLENCGGDVAPSDDLSVSIVAVSGQSGAIVHGKGGYDIDPKAKITTNHVQASPVSVEELRKRLYLPTQSQKAVAAALERGYPTAHGTARDGFVATSYEMPPEETIRCLVRYRDALATQFKLEFPKPLITVYIAQDTKQVIDLAQKLHGVDLPLGTVAYSVFEDLSIVGGAALDACGSLAHELVHLGIRQNFGDSPAWMEEGLASEIAVARPQLSGFQFGPSWRDEMLKEHWTLRPTVSALLKMTWSNYAAMNRDDVYRVAALHAMSATFIRYLDAKGQLLPVYNAMRDNLVNGKDAISDNEILQAKLGMNLDQIDADFVSWFHPPVSNPDATNTMKTKQSDEVMNSIKK